MFEQRCVATEFGVDEDCVGFEPLEADQPLHLKGLPVVHAVPEGACARL